MTRLPLRSDAAACPECGRPGTLVHAGLTDRILEAPGTWSIRGCDACRLAWLDPQPHPDELAALYRGAYMTHDASHAAPPRGAHARYLQAAYGYGGPASAVGRRLRALRVVDDPLGGAVCWLPPSPGGRLLDVGCGNGAFLARMRTLGWTPQGIEPDPAAAAVARDVHGLDVVPAIAALGDRAFEAVTMHHVIEHLSDPAADVAALVRHVAPGGRLVLVTPNIESLGRHVLGSAWVHWDPPRHLRLFSLAALTRLVERAGLAIERAWTTPRYARFAGASALQIVRRGRVAPGTPVWSARLAGAGFQALEHVAGAFRDTAGEELVVIARRG